jgi:hypothetical protein
LYDETDSYINTSPDTLIQIASMIDSLSLEFKMKIHRDFEAYKLEVESNSQNLNNKIQKHVKFEIDDLQIEEMKKDEIIEVPIEENKSETRSQEYCHKELDDIESVEEVMIKSISELHSNPEFEEQSLIKILSSIDKVSNNSSIEVRSIVSSDEKSHLDADFYIHNIKQDVQVGQEFPLKSIEELKYVYKYKKNKKFKINLHDSLSSHSSV